MTVEGLVTDALRVTAVPADTELADGQKVVVVEVAPIAAIGAISAREAKTLKVKQAWRTLSLLEK